MSLITNTENTYLETFTNNKDFIQTVRDTAVNFCGWEEKRFLKDDRYQLILGSKDGSCCIGLIELTLDPVYNVEIQVFRDYDKDRDFHDQFLAIPKPNVNFNESSYQPPQIVLSGSTDNKDLYLQITDNHIFCAAIYNSTVNCCYMGYINPFSDEDQYSFPVFAGGNSQADQNITVEDTICDSFGDNNETYSNFIFGRRNNEYVSDWIMDESGEWNHIGDNGTNNTFQREYDKAIIHPMAANGYNKVFGSFDGSIVIRKPIIISQPNSKGKVSFLGNFKNLYIVEHNQYISEQEIEIEGIRYIVFQDCFRNTDFNNFFLLKIGEV